MSYIPVKMAEAKETNAPFFVEVYVLKLRTGTSYIAAADEDITIGDTVWTAIPFSRDDITRGTDNLMDETTIKIGDVDSTRLAYVMSGFDFRGCTVEIYKIQYPETLSDHSLFLPVFRGYLDAPTYSNGVFSCRVKSFFPTVEVPQREFQTQCNSAFGDENCGMDYGEMKAEIVAVDGNTLTVNGTFPKEHWAHGMAIVNGESRNIKSSDGDTVTVGINFLQKQMVGQFVRLERGCDKTKECCAKLKNLSHFSGFPAIPFEVNYRGVVS